MTATGGLYFVGQGQWQAALGLYLVALFGFYGANTFYDSLIVNVAAADQYERVSALGFSMGYLGSVLLFVFNLWMVLSPATFGFADAAAATRTAFALVALWWLAFTIPLVLFVEERRRASPSLARAVSSQSTMAPDVRRKMVNPAGSMVPAPSSLKSGSTRPAASAKAVSMSSTAVVRLAGVGGS